MVYSAILIYYDQVIQRSRFFKNLHTAIRSAVEDLKPNERKTSFIYSENKAYNALEIEQRYVEIEAFERRMIQRK